MSKDDMPLDSPAFLNAGRVVQKEIIRLQSEVERLNGEGDYPELVGLLRGSLIDPDSNPPLTQADRDNIANVLVGNRWTERRLIRERNTALAENDRLADLGLHWEGEARRLKNAVDAILRDMDDVADWPAATDVQRRAAKDWAASLRALVAVEGGDDA
jgi:hypothetical protein